MIRRFRLPRILNSRALRRLAVASGLALIVVAFLSIIESHAASAQSVIGTCTNTTGINVLPNIYCNQTANWLSNALTNAQRFFTLLVGIEFAWTFILYAFQKENLGELVSALVIKTMGMSFFYFILLNQGTRDFLPKIMMSFMQLGGVVSGTPVNLNDPNSIFLIGTTLASQMFQNLPYANFYFDAFNISNSIYDDLFMALAMLASGFFAVVIAFVLFISFLIAAGQLIMTLIEAYIMVSAGAVLLGFTGSRWTMSFGEKWFGYAFAIGVKLFVISLIIGLGENIFPPALSGCNGGGDAAGICNAIAQIHSTSFYHASDITLLGGVVLNYLLIGASAIIFLMLTTKLPGLASSMLNGSPSLTMGSAMGAFSQVAGAVTGGINAAASIGMGAVNSAAGMVKGVAGAGMDTVNELQDNAKEAAMMVVGAGAGGAGGAMGAEGGGGGGAMPSMSGGEGGGGGMPDMGGGEGGSGGGMPGMGGGSSSGSGSSGGLGGLTKHPAFVVGKGFAKAGGAVASGVQNMAVGTASGAKDLAMAAASPLMSMDEGGGGGSVSIGLKMPD